MNVNLCRKFKNWHYDNGYRYLVSYSGRGTGKSYTVATLLLLDALIRPLRILCAREIQLSLSDSVHKLLCDRIGQLGLENEFHITRTSITSSNGSEFIFKGLRSDPAEIKSMEGVNIAWLEESSNISKASWDILVPTIRKPGSQIWCTFNPARKEDWVYQMFVANTPPKNAMIVPLTIEDNPEFPDVLREEMEECMARDYDAYRHIWLGECVTHSNACVFKGHFVVRECPEFTTEHPYYGTDFGFANDYNTCIECYVKDNTLYITKENFGLGVDMDKLPAFYDKVMKNRRFTMYADCARPETISYLQKQGFNIKPAKKWKGSIEDGVEYLKHFKEIVIDPSCTHLIEEFNKYSYKTDKTSGDILPEIEDKWNHGIDGLRYALSDLITQKKYVKISSNMLTKRR